MTPLPISVFIVAQDEEDRIHHTILSVRDWVTEVIVVDSGSSDGTVALAESLGARVEHRDWDGYGPQKRYAESLCSCDWRMPLDADEAVSAKLAGLIREAFAHGDPAPPAYELPLVLQLPFARRLPPAPKKYWRIKLYDHRRAQMNPDATPDDPLDDTVKVREGATARLDGPLVHRSFRSIEHHIAKNNVYTTAQAADLYRRGRRPGTAELVCIPMLAFLKAYLLRRECLRGMDGFVVSQLYAVQRFTRLAKLREAYARERSRAARDAAASESASR